MLRDNERSGKHTKLAPLRTANTIHSPALEVVTTLLLKIKKFLDFTPVAA